jgi:hypothetical protein
MKIKKRQSIDQRIVQQALQRQTERERIRDLEDRIRLLEAAVFSKPLDCVGTTGGKATTR